MKTLPEAWSKEVKGHGVLTTLTMAGVHVGWADLPNISKSFSLYKYFL